MIGEITMDIKKIRIPTEQTPRDIYGTPKAILTGTLLAGETTVTLTNNAIISTCRFDCYTEDIFLPITDIAVDSTNHTITLTYEAQSSNVNVKVVIFED